MNSGSVYSMINSVFLVLMGCCAVSGGWIRLWNSCGMGCDSDNGGSGSGSVLGF